MGTSAFRLGATQTTTTKLVETISQSAHGFVAGDVIRPQGGGTGAFIKAIADSGENAEGVGVVSDQSTNTFTVVYQGEIISAGLTGFSEADVLFLSPNTSGLLTTTPPTLPGQVIKPMVVMNDTNEGIVVNYIGTSIGGESAVEVTNLQPVGTVVPYGGTAGSIPVGWLMCDGATYSISTVSPEYSDLYDVIGSSFGGSGNNAGGTSGWFAVPDMQGRVPVGGGTGFGALTYRALGASGGAVGAIAKGGNGNGTVSMAMADRSATR